ncbi:MAG: hypothetical protein LE180_06705, partial [Endomicrobium sp.]|nr:hypothetical protein [Endomicrobium sp.]
MMTLRLRRCVSLFVCLSLLLSACSPGKKSSKAGELARNKVKLTYGLCSNKDSVIVDAEKPIESSIIGEMNCVTENGNTTCTKEDNIKCELKKVELCDELGEDCRNFKFGVTPVPCNEPSDKSKGACLPMILREKKEPGKNRITGKSTSGSNDPTGNNGAAWYTPTWYTLITEGVLGVVAILIMREFVKSTTPKILYVATGISAVVGGEIARVVTTRFDVGAVGGGGFTGATGGALMGGVVFSLAEKLLMRSTDGWWSTIETGAIIGTIAGGISGLVTGLE